MTRFLHIVLLALPIWAAKAQERPLTNPSAIRDTTMAMLRPGDIVRLRIWREPDLSGEFVIDESGGVVFPKIGTVNVLGNKWSAQSLRDSLLKSYRVFLRNPSIDIVLLRRISVLGAVMRPGLYPVDPTMTLSDVIALAGGATPLGTPNRVQLLRNGSVVTAKLADEARVGEVAIQSGDQLFVPERNWVTRNSGVVAAALTASVSLLIAVFRH